MPVPWTITVSSLIAGTYAPPAVLLPMTSAIWGIAGGRQPGLVVEDPAEVLAIREDVRLEGQERAARVDQVDARQVVLEGDLLRPEVLLDGQRVVRAALDGGVVGHDDAGHALDLADAGHDPGARRVPAVVAVDAVGGQRAQLEEGRARVDQPVDPLANRQLAARPVLLDRGRVAAGAVPADPRLALAQVGDERLHRRPVGEALGARRIELAAQDGHAPIIAGCHDAARSRLARPGGRPRTGCSPQEDKTPSTPAISGHSARSRGRLAGIVRRGRTNRPNGPWETRVGPSIPRFCSPGATPTSTRAHAGARSGRPRR